ncbi:TonB-dependent receptor [Methylomonas sp. EFPC1]|uniref:TonB-dependent receptor plug domain-containing protein n=1 Tax=Methylomonas sp. EFPC1 TaxID=2812647 RepID=UPI0019682581|nr:TonB-dependent receptor [Methylomonas sp. EFPC1]QSB01052.1 TonB-dependent receptor [Methylomonas sp. EFPC1]
MNNPMQYPQLAAAISLALCCQVSLAEPETDDSKDQPATTSEAPKKDQATELSTMVVSATLSEQSIEDAPGTLHLIDDKQIALRDVRRIGDMVREMPGVYMAIGATSALPPSANRAVRQSIRGISGTARTVVLLDDQKMNDPSFGTVNYGAIFPEDVEQVELVPGAGSALYGGNAFAGTMRIVTKKPTKREVLVKGTYQFDATEGMTASGIYRDVFDNGLAISLGHHHELNDGIRDIWGFANPGGGPITDVTGAIPTTTAQGQTAYLVGDHGRAPWESHNSHIKAYYDFNDYTRISGGVHYFYSDIGYSQDPFNSYLRDANGNPVISGRIRQNGTVLGQVTPNVFLNSPSHEDDLRSFWKFEHNFSADTALTVNFNHTSRDTWFTNVINTSGLGGGPGTSNHTRSTMVNGRAQLVFPLTKSQIITTGFEVDHGEMDRKDYDLSQWNDRDSRTGTRLVADASTDTTSFFAQDEIRFTDQFTAYLGTRVDWWQATGISRDYAFNTFNPESTQESVEVNPKLSLIYKDAWEGATLRASAGKSFRPPTLQDLYVDSRRGVVATVLSNPNLVPESNLSWEVSVDQKIEKTGTQIKATFFENHLSDLISNRVIERRANFTGSQRINAAEALTRGVELSIDQNLTNWLSLFSNYTWTPTATTLSSPGIPASEGKRLPNSPEHLLTMGLEANWNEWSGSLIGRHVSESFDTAENIDVVHDVYGGFQAFWLMDAKIKYSPTKNVSVGFMANNLSNEQYFQFAPNPGRNFLVELSFNY